MGNQQIYTQVIVNFGTKKAPEAVNFFYLDFCIL